MKNDRLLQILKMMDRINNNSQHFVNIDYYAPVFKTKKSMPSDEFALHFNRWLSIQTQDADDWINNQPKELKDFYKGKEI